MALRRLFSEWDNRQMINITKVLICIDFILLGLFLACAPLPEPVVFPDVPAVEKQSWQREWDGTLQEAGKEGKVVVYGSHGPTLRDALTETFRKTHSLIIEWVPGRTAELLPRLKAERRAGLYLADVYITSSTSLFSLKEEGFLDKMEGELIIPQVTEPSTWLEGKLPWVDRDRLIIAPSQAPSYSYIVNTGKVKTGEVSSYQDLLQPQWTGRIAAPDPRVSGARSWVMIDDLLGWEYVVKLSRQVRLASDQRQAVEWTAKGKTDITLSPGEAFLDYLQAGVPLEVVSPKEGVYLTGGGSALALINHRPHPRAARIFLNWYLSREGQQILASTHGYTRVDIDTSQLHPARVRMDGVSYFSVEDEDWIKGALQAEIKIKELVRDR